MTDFTLVYCTTNERLYDYDKGYIFRRKYPSIRYCSNVKNPLKSFTVGTI